MIIAKLFSVVYCKFGLNRLTFSNFNMKHVWLQFFIGHTGSLYLSLTPKFKT